MIFISSKKYKKSDIKKIKKDFLINYIDIWNEWKVWIYHIYKIITGI